MLPPDIQSLFRSDPSAFVDTILGLHWIDDLPLQRSIICFMTALPDSKIPLYLLPIKQATLPVRRLK
jgi:hypothetical protein